MSKTIEQLKHQVELLYDQIREEEAAEAQLARMNPEYLLAIELHDVLCHSNHTDACGWYYEFAGKEHNFAGGAHDHYLIQARKMISLLEKSGMEMVHTMTVLKILKTLA